MNNLTSVSAYYLICTVCPRSQDRVYIVIIIGHCCCLASRGKIDGRSNLMIVKCFLKTETILMDARVGPDIWPFWNKYCMSKK